MLERIAGGGSAPAVSHRKHQPHSAAPVLARRLVNLLLVASLVLVSIFAFLNSSLSSVPSPPHSSPPVPKIYVYDVPEKFTLGLIRSYALARGADPEADLRYPGHQHSAEWHLFTDLTAHLRRSSPLEATTNADEADLFFVPFFSSLSLIVNPIRPTLDSPQEVAERYSDEETQEELVKWLEGRKHWIRNGGRDHVFVCQDPNAMYKVMDRVSKGILLVSDFGRLKADQASLVKDVIVPYAHRISSYNGDVGIESRVSLLFFMGNRYRKEGGKIRDTLFQILENEKDVVIKHGAQSRESRRLATHGMHSSKFCLHPAGDTPTACRLFDAIVSLCIPVVVSDYIELPFEDVIDYSKIAVFVDTKSALMPGFLTGQLRKISTKKILQYQHELKAVKHYFEYEDPNGAVTEIWRQVAAKVPMIKLMTNRDKRLINNDPKGSNSSCIYYEQ